MRVLEKACKIFSFNMKINLEFDYPMKNNSKIECLLTFYSSTHHLWHLLSGFKILNREGVIRLKKIKYETYSDVDTQNQYSNVNKGSLLKAEIDGKTIIYDMHDSIRINEVMLEDCSAYIKRSYSSKFHGPISKVHPFGFYLNAVDSKIDIDRAQLIYKYARGAGRIIGFINALVGRDSPNYSFLKQSFNLSTPPKAIFITRLWPPSQAENADQQLERERINEIRTDCVLTLRRQFGDRFFGGIVADAYSLNFCKEAVITDTRITKRGHYLKMLKQFPVCVSTLGLHGSTGAKFSEYVALGKAIVSEQLSHDLPINFVDDVHFIQYRNLDECTESVGNLLENRELRERMMLKNKIYYEQELRPDVQILKSLLHLF
jgi:hypothetical protein